MDIEKVLTQQDELTNIYLDDLHRSLVSLAEDKCVYIKPYYYKEIFKKSKIWSTIQLIIEKKSVEALNEVCIKQLENQLKDELDIICEKIKQPDANLHSLANELKEVFNVRLFLKEFSDFKQNQSGD